MSTFFHFSFLKKTHNADKTFKPCKNCNYIPTDVTHTILLIKKILKSFSVKNSFQSSHEGPH
uniref:Uncharacterized protein n=1 Tax=Physcomitrium patens TaxID=3218 RepID=A0A2K1K6Q0_PHYPA|nr:hypothetical protein PHYPA_011348 [Physcomitrium patens]